MSLGVWLSCLLSHFFKKIMYFLLIHGFGFFHQAQKHVLSSKITFFFLCLDFNSCAGGLEESDFFFFLCLIVSFALKEAVSVGTGRVTLYSPMHLSQELGSASACGLLQEQHLQA